jgi:hypothetical protein
MSGSVNLAILVGNWLRRQDDRSRRDVPADRIG